MTRLIWLVTKEYLYHPSMKRLVDFGLSKLDSTVNRFRSGGPTVTISRVKEAALRDEAPVIIAVLIVVAVIIWTKG